MINGAINAAVHYNYWENMEKEDFLPVVEAFRDLHELFVCSSCRRLLEKTPRKGNPETVKCPWRDSVLESATASRQWLIKATSINNRSALPQANVTELRSHKASWRIQPRNGNSWPPVVGKTRAAPWPTQCGHLNFLRPYVLLIPAVVRAIVIT